MCPDCIHGNSLVVQKTRGEPNANPRNVEDGSMYHLTYCRKDGQLFRILDMLTGRIVRVLQNLVRIEQRSSESTAARSITVSANHDIVPAYQGMIMPFPTRTISLSTTYPP